MVKMSRMNAIMMLIGSCLLLVVSSFTTPQKFPFNQGIFRQISSTYQQQQQMRRSATASRVHRSMSSSDDASTQQSPWVSDKAPKSAKEKASFKNQVPFREEVYETVKGAIELLTKRLNMNKDLASIDMNKLSLDEQAALSMKTLAVDEAQWLTAAVEVILDDAYKYGPPARPIKINAAQENGTSQ